MQTQAAGLWSFFQQIKAELLNDWDMHTMNN